MNSRMFVAALFTCMASLVENAEEKENVPPSKNEIACRVFGTTFSYFDPELVIGPEWRIYYTWNVKKKNNCLGMKFYSINPWVSSIGNREVDQFNLQDLITDNLTSGQIVHRFWRDMGQYLTSQPNWGNPVLYATVGAAKHQFLFLADYGTPGRVHGVPNLSREPAFTKNKQKVPLMQMQMKLFRGAKYLIMMDCVGGEITLSARYQPKEPPYAAEIEILAELLGFGQGSLACKTIRG